jgi:hypothetical protein
MLHRPLAIAVLAAAPLLGQHTPCYADFAGPNFISNWFTGGAWIGIKLRSTLALPVTRIELHTGNRTGTAGLELWSHDATLDRPLARLGGGTFFLQQAIGWQGVSCAPVVILPNQGFWLVWKPVGGEIVSAEAQGQNLPGAQPYRGSFDQGQNWNGPFTQYQWKIRMFCGGQQPGAFANYGRGCAGSNQLVPAIGAQGVPTLGQRFVLTLRSALPSVPALLGLGTSYQRWGAVPLPLDLRPYGAPGCTLLAEPSLQLVAVTDASGAVQLGLTVPVDPSMVGTTLFGQWLPRDAAANGLQFSFSDGGALTIGT